MCCRGTLWASFLVAVLAGLYAMGVGKAFGAAAAQEEEIRKDDTIEVVTDTAPVKKGTPTLTTVEKGTKLKAIEVETNESGTWIKVKVEKDGKPIEGYIHKRHLKRVPEAPRPKPQPGEPPAKPEGGKVEGDGPPDDARPVPKELRWAWIVVHSGVFPKAGEGSSKQLADLAAQHFGARDGEHYRQNCNAIGAGDVRIKRILARVGEPDKLERNKKARNDEALETYWYGQLGLDVLPETGRVKYLSAPLGWLRQGLRTKAEAALQDQPPGIQPQPGKPPAKPEGGKVEGGVALEPVPATDAQRQEWARGLMPGMGPAFGVSATIYRSRPGPDGEAGSLMTEQENKQFTEFVSKTSLKDKQGRKAVVEKLVSIVGLKRARGITLKFTDGEGRLGWVWPPSER